VFLVLSVCVSLNICVSQCVFLSLSVFVSLVGKKALDGIKSAPGKVVEFYEWGKKKAYDYTLGQFEFGRKAKEKQEQYEDIKGINEDYAVQGLEGAKKGLGPLMNPNDDGSYADQYQQELGELGDATEKKTREMAEEAIKNEL